VGLAELCFVLIPWVIHIMSRDNACVLY
jgi:hypothetical protein